MRRIVPASARRALALAACCLAVVGLALGCMANFAAEPAAAMADDAGLRFQRLERSEPRALSINVLVLDLQDPRYDLAVAVAADPDGDGPAEAELTPPTELAAAHHLIAAMNANAFAAVGEKSHAWYRGMPVDIAGLAALDATNRSAAQQQYPMFWQSADLKLHVGWPDQAQAESARLGVAGFNLLLTDGELKTRPGDALHPRSAIGYDKTGRYLTFVVVDGRQEGFSEGMSTHELALLMQELGCSDAVNLDGGGSSILLMAGADGKLEARNRPSTRAMGVSLHRPVPVMIGVRRR